jgi:hypothetical protein
MVSLLRKKQERHRKGVCVPRVKSSQGERKESAKEASILGFLAQPALGRLLAE